MTPEEQKPKFPALTAQVAAFAASTRIDDIPPEAQRLCKKSMLDSLGTGLSGSLAPVSDVFRRYLRQLGCGEGPSRAIGTNLRLPPRFAALLNGIIPVFNTDLFARAHVRPASYISSCYNIRRR